MDIMLANCGLKDVGVTRPFANPYVQQKVGFLGDPVILCVVLLFFIYPRRLDELLSIVLFFPIREHTKRGGDKGYIVYTRLTRSHTRIFICKC